MGGKIGKLGQLANHNKIITITTKNYQLSSTDSLVSTGDMTPERLWSA